MKKITKILIIEFAIIHIVLTILWLREELFFSYPFYLMLANAFLTVCISLITAYKQDCECKKPEFVTETKNHIFFECQRCKKEFQFKIKDFKKKGFRATNIRPT